MARLVTRAFMAIAGQEPVQAQAVHLLQQICT